MSAQSIQISVVSDRKTEGLTIQDFRMRSLRLQLGFGIQNETLQRQEEGDFRL